MPPDDDMGLLKLSAGYPQGQSASGAPQQWFLPNGRYPTTKPETARGGWYLRCNGAWRHALAPAMDGRLRLPESSCSLRPRLRWEGGKVERWKVTGAL